MKPIFDYENTWLIRNDSRLSRLDWTWYLWYLFLAGSSFQIEGGSMLSQMNMIYIHARLMIEVQSNHIQFSIENRKHLNN